MSWQELNNHELQAMRKLLMLDVSEAAELIGKVSNRTWQYWEAGRNKVPADVDMEMYALVSQMQECINGAFEEDNDVIKWYHTFEDFQKDYEKGNHVWWKVHQAVCGQLFADGEANELRSDIEADKESYIYKFFSRTREEDIEHERQEKIFRDKGIID